MHSELTAVEVSHAEEITNAAESALTPSHLQLCSRKAVPLAALLIDLSWCPGAAEDAGWLANKSHTKEHTDP